MNKKDYNYPAGYSFMQTAFKSNKFIENPIIFMQQSIGKFGNTYSASLGIKKKILITQNADFISYVLKDNQKNYKKSPLSTERAVELFGNGLLFSNGEYWREQRRLIQPAFHKDKLSGLYENIIKTIHGFLPDFTAGERVDIYPLVHQVSFNILLNSLFDISLKPAHVKELNIAFGELQDFLMKDINQPIKRLFYPINGAKRFHLNKAKRIREIFKEIIEERKNTEGHFTDLLDMLLHSKYEDTGTYMNEEQITDELLILIFAGHETTANTLSWLLYLLAEDETVLKKLTATFTENVYDSLNNNYLKATINEGMRLYPAAWMTERIAIADDSFDGINFAKGTIIIPFFFGLHRDENLWTDAGIFNPERFLNDNNLMKVKHYFPFGAGPRMCIGNNFAMAEMCFFLHEFLRVLTIKSTGEKVDMKPLITLRPKEVVLNVQRIV
ncbi:MAG: cytochrome P450 [Ferruginibacter sp.]